MRLRALAARLAKEAKGVSMVELLVVMAIMGIVGTVLGTLVFTSTRITTTTQERLNEINDGRTAMDTMARVIRTAIRPLWVTCGSVSVGCPTNVPSVAIETANPTYLRFYADIDNVLRPTASSASLAPANGPSLVEIYTTTDPTTGRTILVETILPAVPSAGPSGTTYTWPNATCQPLTTGCTKTLRVLAQNVVSSSGTTPLFAYYLYGSPSPVTGALQPSQFANIDGVDITLTLADPRIKGKMPTTYVNHVVMPNIDTSKISASPSP